jgi:hypothetical protein
MVVVVQAALASTTSTAAVAWAEWCNKAMIKLVSSIRHSYRLILALFDLSLRALVLIMCYDEN